MIWPIEIFRIYLKEQPLNVSLMIYKSFDKETASLADKNASGGAVKRQTMLN